MHLQAHVVELPRVRHATPIRGHADRKFYNFEFSVGRGGCAAWWLASLLSLGRNTWQ